MPGQLTATIRNDFITVPLSLITEAELRSIQNATSYRDRSIDYQLKAAGPWTPQARIDALKAALDVELWKIENDCLVLPQGFLNLIPGSVILKDERVLPAPKKMIWAKKPKHECRYYQREAIEALRLHSRGQAVMATGTGKSFTMLNLIREMGMKTLVICPSSIIAGQLFEDFSTALGTKVVGMYGAGKKQIKQVTVGLYQSVCRNIEAFKDFELVICDENQTLGAGSLVAITRNLGHVPYFYSVSATNYRADGKTPEIYAASGEVRYEFDTVRAISEGYLATPVFLMRSVSSWGKQFDLKQKNYVAHVVENEQLNDRIVKDALTTLSAGKSTLILVQEIAHGEHLAGRLGLPFANGENKDSMQLIKELNKGNIKGLIAGAQMCGVGVDTVRVDCLIMASFPGTKGLTTQLVGRGLRKYEGKIKVMVLDYKVTGNDMLSRHADKRVEWYSELGTVKEVSDVKVDA
jgi:superfamily II DNA or RNA helicase